MTFWPSTFKYDLCFLSDELGTMKQQAHGKINQLLFPRLVATKFCFGIQGELVVESN